MEDDISIENEEIIKKWFSESLKKWLERYHLDIEIVSSSWNDFRIAILNDKGKKEFDIKTYDLEELLLSINEKRYIDIDNSYSIKSIFRISNEIYTTFFSSSDPEKVLSFNRMNFRIREGEYFVELNISNSVTFTHLIILVEQNAHPRLNEEILEDAKTFTELFQAGYIDFSIKGFETKSNLNLITEIILSSFFYLNEICDFSLIPIGLGISVKENLQYLCDDIIFEQMDTTKPETYYLRSYNVEALLYFLSAERNQDIRFKYLGFYHVLEFYYDTIVLERVSNILKNEIKNPVIFHDESKIHEISEKLKNEIFVSKKEFIENSSLTKILEIIKEENHFRDYSSEKKILSKLTDKLPQLTIDDFNAEEIASRIYNIRNGIVHSKKEFDFKLIPNSNYLDLLDNDVFLIKKIASWLIKRFDKNFEINN